MYGAEPHEITSTLFASLLTIFTLIQLTRFPLMLQVTSHTSGVNTVRMRQQRQKERDYFLLAIVYVRKYAGHFLH